MSPATSRPFNPNPNPLAGYLATSVRPSYFTESGLLAETKPPVIVAGGFILTLNQKAAHAEQKHQPTDRPGHPRPGRHLHPLRNLVLPRRLSRRRRGYPNLLGVAESLRILTLHPHRAGYGDEVGEWNIRSWPVGWLLFSYWVEEGGNNRQVYVVIFMPVFDDVNRSAGRL